MSRLCVGASFLILMNWAAWCSSKFGEGVVLLLHILVVEDDRLLNEGICFALNRQGFGVRGAFTLAEAGRMLEGAVDLVLLDINLPDGDGRDFLSRLRALRDVPVIFVTARDTEQDMLLGFDAGCDDYVVTPFSIPVLVKKIQALVKRQRAVNVQLAISGELTYDFLAKTLYKQDEEVRLTATEHKLLALFLHHRGQVLTREQILAAVWDAEANYVDENTLNVNVRRLREKLEEDPKNPQHILTVFGIGYKWSEGSQ